MTGMSGTTIESTGKGLHPKGKKITLPADQAKAAVASGHWKKAGSKKAEPKEGS